MAEGPHTFTLIAQMPTLHKLDTTHTPHHTWVRARVNGAPGDSYFELGTPSQSLASAPGALANGLITSLVHWPQDSNARLMGGPCGPQASKAEYAARREFKRIAALYDPPFAP